MNCTKENNITNFRNIKIYNTSPTGEPLQIAVQFLKKELIWYMHGQKQDIDLYWYVSIW